MCRPMNFNPFRGYSQTERDIRNRQVREQIKDIAKLEGAPGNSPRWRRGCCLHAHRGPVDWSQGQYGPGHAPCRRCRDQQMYQGHRRCGQSNRRVRSACFKTAKWSLHIEPAGSPHHLGPPSHGHPRTGFLLSLSPEPRRAGPVTAWVHPLCSTFFPCPPPLFGRLRRFLSSMMCGNEFFCSLESDSMPIRMNCPACDRQYNLADTMRGKRVSCKNCAQSL